MIEMPVAIFILLIAVAFPLWDLATLGIGTSAVHSACRVAAVAAAKEPGFNNDVTVNGQTYLSVIKTAKQVASGLSTSGVSMPESNITVSAWQIPLALDPNSGAAQPPQPFAAPVDLAKYIYQIKVNVTGSVQPLITLDKKLFGDVPGLTGPLVVNAQSMAIYETPKGLLN